MISNETLVEAGIPPKPSICCHNEIWVNDYVSICKHCKRKRVILDGLTLFIYLNGVVYLRRMKGGGK